MHRILLWAYGVTQLVIRGLSLFGPVIFCFNILFVYVKLFHSKKELENSIVFLSLLSSISDVVTTRVIFAGD